MTPSTTQPTSTYAQHGSTQPCRRRATSYRHPTRHNVEPSSDVPRTPPALVHPSASTTRNYPASWPPRVLVRLPPRAPRNRSTARHNKPTHATAPTKRTCVSTTRAPQHYQRTTWKHTALPAPRNILQAPNATQRRTVIRRSPNTSRTGPSVREHHAKLLRIMASARPSSLTPPRPAQSQHSATQQANTRHRPNQTHLCFHHACATTLSTILRRNADSASRHLQRPNYAYANISVSSIHYAHDNTYSDTINYAPTII